MCLDIVNSLLPNAESNNPIVLLSHKRNADINIAKINLLSFTKYNFNNFWAGLI